MAYDPVIGSIVAFQKPGSVLTTGQLAGSILAVSGTLTTPAGSIATVVFPAGSVGAVAVSNFPAVQPVSPNNSSLFSLQPAGSILAVSGSFTPAANQSVSGAVTAPPGSVMMTAQLAGSVLAVSGSFTPAGNQSVSGAVTSPPGSITSVTFPAGSTVAVLATQVTSPWIVAPNNSSLYSLQPAGSILAVSGSFTAPANQSVSGAVTFPAGSIATVVNPAGSVGAVLVNNFPAVQVVAPNNSSLYSLQLAGSILAVSGSFTPAANQSVSGEVNVVQTTSPWITATPAGSVTQVRTDLSSVITVQKGGSVLAVSAVQPAGSLLTAIQLAGSVMAVSGSFTPAANQSVSGTVNIGTGGPVSVTGTMSVIGTVPVTQSGVWAPVQLAGSIMAVSGSFTPAANQSISGAITAPPGSVMAVRINDLYQEETVGGPSIRGIALVWESNVNTSVMSTVSPTNPLRVLGSVSGATTTTAGSIMSVTNPAGSITAVSAVQPGGSVMNVAQVAGSILSVTVRSGSVVSNAAAGSILAVTVVSGSTLAFAPAGSLMAVVVNAGSIITNASAGSILAVTVVSGSVIANQAAGSLMTVINPAGSVTATTAILIAPSIVGTYAEDAGHATGDKGLATWAVRNDTMASLVSADLDYAPYAVDSQGRTIIKPFSPEDGTIISYVGSTVSGSVQLIQASVVGKKTYITDFWISNTGSTTALVTLQDGTTSLIGQFIAPAGGGMASPGLAIPLKPVVVAGSDLAFKVAPSQSVLYLVVKGYQAQ